MEFVIIIVIAAFAALMQAVVGFGFAVIFTPLLSLAMGAREAIALSMILGMALSLVLYLDDPPRAPLRSVLPMFLAATAVTPIGVYVLAVADERVLRVGIGIAVLASVIGTFVTSHPAAERPEHLPTTLGVGVLSGVMRGATSMGGPPVVIYEHWRGAPTLTIRRRLLAYFALTGITGAVFATGSGVVTLDTLAHAVAGLPVVVIALYGGRYIRPRLSDSWFRLLSMGLLVLMGAVSIIGAFR
ncbi:MAG: sulfite exporter TauE/SafE family protein [Dehalococcoidia bacterium]|nr:sulfite exporter TauE/SafE family protein [Dehalococcoidia bacterium]